MKLKLTIALFCLVATGYSRSDVRVDSTRPVKSPNGEVSCIVDQIVPLLDGEPERFSGRMMVRVTDSQGTTTRQRFIETSQIRIINPPQWIDSRWAAFSYNISKNSSGIVYFDSLTADALQVEFVATTRRMGATGKTEFELTDFEVTDHGTSSTTYFNVTAGSRPVFPLYLQSIPPYDGKPFPKAFLDKVRAAIVAFRDACARHNINDLEVEQATESFSKSNTHCALLACLDGQPACISIRLNAPDAGAAMKSLGLFRLGQDVALFACASEIEEPVEAAEPEDGDVEHEQHVRFRFTTSWKDDNQILVEKESFDVENEDDPPMKTPAYSLTLNGNIEKLSSEAGEKAVPSTSEAEPASDISGTGAKASSGETSGTGAGTAKTPSSADQSTKD